MVSTRSLLPHDGDFVIFHESILNTYNKPPEFRKVAKDLGIYIYCLRIGVTGNSQLKMGYQAICDLLWPPPTWFWHDTFQSCGIFEKNSSQCLLNSLQKASVSTKKMDNQMPILKRHMTGDSKLKFEGVDIRSDLVPTLQKIWEKHGNIVEGGSVHSKDMLACALESLAKAVTILQSSSVSTLTKSTCDDLHSILLDLKQLNLRVEWLDPYVKKAVALHHSKLLVDVLEDLDKSIAKAKEMKITFTKELTNLHEVERSLEEDRMLVSESIPIKGQVNLDQCVGDGLL